MISPGIHSFSGCLKSLTNTLSPRLNVHSAFDRFSWAFFCCNWCLTSTAGMSGFNNDKQVRGCLFRNISAKVSSVTVWGVFLYVNRNRTSHCWGETDCTSSLVQAFLNVYTACSTAPLDAGWLGGDSMWQTPLLLRNCSNSADVNGGQLSDTSTFGKPYDQKGSCKDV